MRNATIIAPNNSNAVLCDSTPQHLLNYEKAGAIKRFFYRWFLSIEKQQADHTWKVILSESEKSQDMALEKKAAFVTICLESDKKAFWPWRWYYTAWIPKARQTRAEHLFEKLAWLSRQDAMDDLPKSHPLQEIKNSFSDTKNFECQKTILALWKAPLNIYWQRAYAIMKKNFTSSEETTNQSPSTVREAAEAYLRNWEKRITEEGAVAITLPKQTQEILSHTLSLNIDNLSENFNLSTEAAENFSSLMQAWLAASYLKNALQSKNEKESLTCSILQESLALLQHKKFPNPGVIALQQQFDTLCQGNQTIQAQLSELVENFHFHVTTQLLTWWSQSGKSLLSFKEGSTCLLKGQLLLAICHHVILQYHNEPTGTEAAYLRDRFIQAMESNLIFLIEPLALHIVDESYSPYSAELHQGYCNFIKPLLKNPQKINLLSTTLEKYSAQTVRLKCLRIDAKAFLATPRSTEVIHFKNELSTFTTEMNEWLKKLYTFKTAFEEKSDISPFIEEQINCLCGEIFTQLIDRMHNWYLAIDKMKIDKTRDWYLTLKNIDPDFIEVILDGYCMEFNKNKLKNQPVRYVVNSHNRKKSHQAQQNYTIDHYAKPNQKSTPLDPEKIPELKAALQDKKNPPLTAHFCSALRDIISSHHQKLIQDRRDWYKKYPPLNTVDPLCAEYEKTKKKYLTLLTWLHKAKLHTAAEHEAWLEKLPPEDNLEALARLYNELFKSTNSCVYDMQLDTIEEEYRLTKEALAICQPIASHYKELCKKYSKLSAEEEAFNSTPEINRWKKAKKRVFRHLHPDKIRHPIPSQYVAGITEQLDTLNENIDLLGILSPEIACDNEIRYKNIEAVNTKSQLFDTVALTTHLEECVTFLSKRLPENGKLSVTETRKTNTEINKTNAEMRKTNTEIKKTNAEIRAAITQKNAKIRQLTIAAYYIVFKNYPTLSDAQNKRDEDVANLYEGALKYILEVMSTDDEAKKAEIMQWEFFPEKYAEAQEVNTKNDLSHNTERTTTSIQETYGTTPTGKNDHCRLFNTSTIQKNAENQVLHLKGAMS